MFWFVFDYAAVLALAARLGAERSPHGASCSSTQEPALTIYYNNKCSRRWWLRLFEQSKEHVIIETTLIVAILYILLVKKSYDPSKRGSAKEELTEREEEELLQEWQPEPLGEGPPHCSQTLRYMQRLRQSALACQTREASSQ